MLGLPALGFGNVGEVMGGLAARRTVTTVAPQHAAVRNVEVSALVENEGLRDDVIKLDHLARDVEPAALADDLARARAHGAAWPPRSARVRR